MNILTVVAIAVLAIGGMEEITVTAVQTGWGSGGKIQSYIFFKKIDSHTLNRSSHTLQLSNM